MLWSQISLDRSLKSVVVLRCSWGWVWEERCRRCVWWEGPRVLEDIGKCEVWLLALQPQCHFLGWLLCVWSCGWGWAVAASLSPPYLHCDALWYLSAWPPGLPFMYNPGTYWGAIQCWVQSDQTLSTRTTGKHKAWHLTSRKSQAC